MRLATFGINPILFYKAGLYKSIDDAINAFANYGINSVEIETSDFQLLPIEELCHCFEKKGIKVQTLIVLTSFAIGSAENYRKEIELVKGFIDAAENNKIKFVMIVPEGFLPADAKEKKNTQNTIIKGMRELVEHAAGKDITVTIENFSLDEYPYSTIDEIEAILNSVPGLKYTLDSGNFCCVGNDVLEAYERLKPYIVNIHLKDFREDEQGMIIRPSIPRMDGCTLGQGIVPVRELLRKLQLDNYKGTLVIEINTEKMCPKMIMDSVDFIRGVVNV